jgi:hypothetical protein
MRRPLCLLLALGLLATGAVAQTSTGRHRTERPAEEPPPREDFDDTARSWSFHAGAGALAAGDLARVRTAGSAGIPWDPPGGPEFNSDSFTLTLDESILLALGVGHRLSDRVWVRAAVSLAQLDVAARARVGQSAEVYRWDQLAVLLAGLDAELRLVRSPSYFYLVGGASLVRLSGQEGDQLDDTGVALRVGAGYHQRLAPGWGLRVEVRNNLAAIDRADLAVPVAGEGVSPDLRVEDSGTDHFWEILASLQTTF